MQTIKKLNDYFKAEHYDVYIKIDEKNYKFKGEIKLKGELLESSNSIWLHANGLTIEKATIDAQTAKTSKQSKHHEIELVCDEELTQGNHEVIVNFSGAITDALQGIYPSRFKHDGTEKMIFATQFESHHAREAFPCIDEPAAKATFQLTIEAEEGSTIVSNTLEQESKNENQRQTVTFKKTPKMSTYLLAFASGEMHSVEAEAKDGTLVRSFASVAQPKENLEYSVKEAVDILGFFSDYFDVPYPLEKCDQIALPDFDAGAMENWGMVTYREIALLTDAKNPSVSSQQYVSLVVAHELSHQWFGNLVTMKWWDDLWLNESFASIMEHVALDSLHPDWKQWEHYTSMDVISTTNRDIYKDIQPVSVEVTDPELIERLFDPGIVYAKGGRLIKMLIEFIGEEKFRAGLKSYFDEYQYSNASRDDLWRHLSEASDQDIKSLMDSWILQPGMPELEVSVKDSKVALKQSRFSVDNADDDQIWPIPLLSADLGKDKILSEKIGSFEYVGDLPLMNEFGSAHYVLNYSNDFTDRLTDGVINGEMSSEAKINTLNDMLLLARAGENDMILPLELASNMKNEPRNAVWSIVFRVINTAQQLVEGNDSAKPAFKKLRYDLAHENFEKLGWDDAEGDDSNTKQLRSSAISLMLSAEDEKALEESVELINKSKSIQNIPSENRISIMAAQIRAGNKDMRQQLLDLYEDVDSELQNDIAIALAASKDPDFTQSVFEKAFGKDGFVRSQDVLRWIAYHLRNYHIREVTWDYLVDNWDWFAEQLSNSKAFDFLPVYCSQVINTEEWEAKFHDLFSKFEDHPALGHNVNIGYSDIKARVEWRKREEQSVLDWLNRYQNN